VLIQGRSVPYLIVTMSSQGSIAESSDSQETLTFGDGAQEMYGLSKDKIKIGEHIYFFWVRQVQTFIVSWFGAFFEDTHALL